MASMSTNGKGKSNGASKGKGKPAPHGQDGLERCCVAYIVLAALLSCGLNAQANVRHAPEGWRSLAAAALGCIIPALVLLAGRVAGYLYKRGMPWGAIAVGFIASVALGLSVWHCQDSIAVLTGANPVLATAMAITIDAGMIACEAAHTLAAAPKKTTRRRKDKPAAPAAQ
jgi:predicted anti-sigma-YlaC factor YlaD